MGILEELGLDCSSSKTVTEMKNELFEIHKRTVHRQNSPNIEKRLRAELLLVRIGDISSMLDNISDESFDASLLICTYAYMSDNNLLNSDVMNSLIAAANKNLTITEKVMNSLKSDAVLFKRWNDYYKNISGGLDSNSANKPKYRVVRSVVNKQTLKQPDTLKQPVENNDLKNAIKATSSYILREMKAKSVRLVATRDRQGSLLVGAEHCRRFIFRVSCIGLFLGDDVCSNYSDDNPLKAEVIIDGKNNSRIRRIDLYSDGYRVFSTSDYDGLTPKAIQEIKRFANFNLANTAGTALKANDFSKALSCYSEIMKDDQDAWSPRFFVPCIKVIICNNNDVINHLADCRRAIILTYDEFSKWSDKNTKQQQVVRVCDYAILASESAWNCAKRANGKTLGFDDANGKRSEFARISYECALLAALVGNQLEARFMKEIPIKNSMINAWNKSLSILEDALNNADGADRAQIKQLYDSTKNRYELYGKKLNVMAN